MPEWFSLPSLLLGMVLLAALVAVWYGIEDYLLPWWKNRRRDRRANLEIAKRALNKPLAKSTFVKYEDTPRGGGQVEPEVSFPPPVRPAPSDGPDTTDLPATQEHPAPTTGLIDFSQKPPPPPWTGPERRLRSDNPYPELRRRAEDRERQEAEDAARPRPGGSAAMPRESRADARRRREAEESAAASQPSERSE